MSSDKKESDVKRVAIVSGIAAAAGFITGILTAPKSGKRTRADLKSAADQGYAKAEKELKNLTAELSNVITQAKETGTKFSEKAQKDLDSLVVKAKDGKERAREVISAIHEGEAEDKDLQKAIKEADEALKHLRDFLDK
jgi:gas vesicle protein